MGDIHDDATTAETSSISSAMRLRIDALRELIALLAVAPASAQSEEDLSPTVETFRQLSERLGRLVAQAGMAHCARAMATLEHVSAGLPSDESFRDVDAVLAYLREKLLDVTLPSLPAISAVTITPAAHAAPADEEAAGGDAGSADKQGEPEQADDNIEGYETLDESQLSAKTRAIIRDFQQATLRERAPGEITRLPHRSAREVSNEIPEHLRRRVVPEALEDLADMHALLASFGKMPGSLDDLHAMAQLAHKVKGTAATYAFPVLAETLHYFEGTPQILRPVAVSRSDDCLSLLIRFAEVIEAALHEAGEQGDASEARLHEAQALAAEARGLVAEPAAKTRETAPIAAVVDITADAATIQLPSVHRAGDDDLLRVEPRKLDRLMHQSDSLAMNRAILAQTSEEIRRNQVDTEQVFARLAHISAQLSDLQPYIRQTGAAALHPGVSGQRWLAQRESSAGEWDEQELDPLIAFEEAMRQLTEAVTDASALNIAMQGQIQRLARNSDAQRAVLHSMHQAIIHLRLVNLKPLADRILLAAHQVAQSNDRQVEVSILGQETEIDRNISDALVAPILQLVRNAVDHGIEPPTEREAQGKPAAGKVWLHASCPGSEVTIEVGDDGRGLNPHQLIAAAIAAGILDAKSADFLTREQALTLMFEPHLSTSAQVDVISGHGIGLDSVLAAIQRLRGSITVHSEQGHGTVFQIRVPISLSITRALHVVVDEDVYAIPLSAVRKMFAAPEAAILVSLSDGEPRTLATRFPRRLRVARSAPEQPLRLPDDPTAALYDEVPVFSLAELLGFEEQPRTTHMALLMDVGQRQVAVLVDDALDESEVVIRALPAHLRSRAVRGASIMPDGRLFLALDLDDLLREALVGKTPPRPQPQPEPSQPRQRIPQALVVDDSISMRRALEVTLASVGYDVRVARDGVEALGMMVADTPDIVLLDIEMPRLDGFELLSVLSGSETLARVPVVMLTSRAIEKHHSRALELGARAYLTKPCPDDVLITTLQRVLRESRQPS